MKKLLVYSSLLLLLAASCNKKDDDKKQHDTMEYFMEHLEAGMSYEAMVSAFGQPDDDIGSGIHIYVYELSDGSSIYIGHDGNHLLYARHVNSAGQVLHNII
jgi:hypothetical protein